MTADNDRCPSNFMQILNNPIGGTLLEIIGAPIKISE
jgi:hypothetical protein